MYIVESVATTSAEIPQPVILHGVELDFSTDLSRIKYSSEGAQNDGSNLVSCAQFCSNDKSGSPVNSAEVRAKTVGLSFRHDNLLYIYIYLKTSYVMVKNFHFKSHSKIFMLRVQLKSK